jgi:hypothetical protein
MDGTRLAFVTPHPNGRDYRLVTMAAAGGELSADLMIASTFFAGRRKWPLIGEIAWMPDGDRLLVARLGEGETGPADPRLGATNARSGGALWEVTLAGAARKLGQLRLPPVSGVYLGVSSFSVHPDGKQLAFQNHEGSITQTWALDNLLQFIKAGGQ